MFNSNFARLGGSGLLGTGFGLQSQQQQQPQQQQTSIFGGGGSSLLGSGLGANTSLTSGNTSTLTGATSETSNLLGANLSNQSSSHLQQQLLAMSNSPYGLLTRNMQVGFSFKSRS